MSSKKSSSEKRSAESAVTKLNSKFRLEDDDFDPNLFSDVKGLASALYMIKERARKDGQRKKEETISSVAKEMRSTIDEFQSKIEKERQNFSKALSKFKREAFLINETVKFQEIYEKFCKEKAAYLQAIKGYNH